MLKHGALVASHWFRVTGKFLLTVWAKMWWSKEGLAAIGEI